MPGKPPLWSILASAVALGLAIVNLGGLVYLWWRVGHREGSPRTTDPEATLTTRVGGPADPTLIHAGPTELDDEPKDGG